MLFEIERLQLHVLLSSRDVPIATGFHNSWFVLQGAYPFATGFHLILLSLSSRDVPIATGFHHSWFLLQRTHPIATGFHLILLSLSSRDDMKSIYAVWTVGVGGRSIVVCSTQLDIVRTL